MKTRYWAILILFLCGNALAGDADDVKAHLYKYFATFSAGDAEKVANEIYSTPLHTAFGTSHGVMATPDAAVENLGNLYEEWGADGWAESRINRMDVCMATDNIALVDTRYSNLNKDGEQLPPGEQAIIYVLQKIEGNWRVIAYYGLDSDKQPRC